MAVRAALARELRCGAHTRTLERSRSPSSPTLPPRSVAPASRLPSLFSSPVSVAPLSLLLSLPLLAARVQMLNEKLAFRFKSVRDAFNAFDQNHSGFIEDDEMRNNRACARALPLSGAHCALTPHHARTYTQSSGSGST